MSGLQLFTWIHTLISLVGIAAGFVVMYGFLSGKSGKKWTTLFLSTTIATSVTGFMFPFRGIQPPHVLGFLSLLVLALALWALYHHHLEGRWRQVYMASAITAQYFNFFVLIVQAFQKIPVLNAYAPTQTEMPFKLTQLVALIAFTTSIVFANRKARS